MTTYLNLCEPPYNFPKFSDRASALAGASSLALPYRQAVEAASAARAKLVYPEGFFPIEQSRDHSGLSDVELWGAGKGKTVLVATSALNGSDNIQFNDVIHALNWSPIDPVNGGYPHKRHRGGDMTIDCFEQNFSGMTEAIRLGRLGYSLAAWEIMDVDDVEFHNIEVLGAYGNGLVASSSNPLLYDTQGRRVGIRNPQFRNIDLIDCLRGVLPQYWSPWAPGGITGTGIQIGACLDGLVDNVRMERLSGPAWDLFNCKNLRIQNVTIRDFGTYSVGASNNHAYPFQQMVGGLRSDFGLIDCHFENWTFDGIGGVFCVGNQDIFFQNGGVPTVGPTGCTFNNFRMSGLSGRKQIAAPPLGASASVYTHRRIGDIYTYPLLITFFGGAGISLLIYRAGSGAPEVVPLNARNQVVLHHAECLQVFWDEKPSGWMWEMSPNIDHHGVLCMSGTQPGKPAQARRNTYSNFDIEGAGQSGFASVDMSDSVLSNVRVRNPGAVSSSRAIVLTTGSNEDGSGSQSNILMGCSAEDSRSIRTMQGLYADSSPRDSGNKIVNCRIGLSTGTGIVTAASDTYTAGNTGPGAT